MDQDFLNIWSVVQYIGHPFLFLLVNETFGDEMKI